jgi:hypothetical protein
MTGPHVLPSEIRLRALLLALLASVFPLMPSPALAWTSDGHRVIGAIADRLLVGTRTADQIQSILGSSLRSASVWADCVKGSVMDERRTLRYRADPVFTECRLFENPPSETAMVDFARRNWDGCGRSSTDDLCHKQYHYTDVAIQRDAYRRGSVGTSDHDVVAAIDASIEVLRGHRAPPPFDIRDKREALRLLAHLVGDVHQPLHVVAIYLDANGRLVDPDLGGLDRRSKTRGGNDLWHDDQNLHAEWDAIPRNFKTRAFLDQAVGEARHVLQTPGPVRAWATLWATDTIRIGKRAFEDVRYSIRDDAHRWSVTLPPHYSATRERVQRDRLIKAGARLAQLLQAVLP